jgi:hypothetical protein
MAGLSGIPANGKIAAKKSCHSPVTSYVQLFSLLQKWLLVGLIR